MDQKNKTIKKNSNHFHVLEDGNISSEDTDKTLKCAKAIEAILNKYDCRMDVIVVLRRNKMIPRIHIVTADSPEIDF